VSQADPLADFAYMVPSEKFVYRSAGAWNLTEIVGKEGIEHHLLEIGWEGEAIKTVLEERAYLKVYGWDLAPGQKSVFANEEGRCLLNTWRPPDLKPAPGDWPTIRRVVEWLTRGDPKGVEWLLGWMAWKIQQPDLVPKLAVVLATQPGGGKGTLAHCMRLMLGPQNTSVLKREELESRFNARWVDKLFVLADEVLSHENVKDISQLLKILIDGNEIQLEAKHRDGRAVRNRLAWMFASNDSIAPVVVEQGDRRYSVFANHEPLPAGYRASLDACFEADRVTMTPAFSAEVAAFYDYLLKLPVDREFVSRPFDNVDRRLLVEASLPTHEMFFRHVDEGGLDEILDTIAHYHDFAAQQSRAEWDFGPEGVACQMVYRAYQEFCKRIGGKPLKMNRFGVAAQNRPGAWPKVRRSNGRRQVYCYVVPRTTSPEPQ
jgi:hypothetical protein